MVLHSFACYYASQACISIEPKSHAAHIGQESNWSSQKRDQRAIHSLVQTCFLWDVGMWIEEKAAKTKIREVPLLVFSNQIIEWCSMITSRAFSFHRASLVLRFAIGPLFCLRRTSSIGAPTNLIIFGFLSRCAKQRWQRLSKKIENQIKVEQSNVCKAKPRWEREQRSERRCPPPPPMARRRRRPTLPSCLTLPTLPSSCLSLKQFESTSTCNYLEWVSSVCTKELISRKMGKKDSKSKRTLKSTQKRRCILWSTQKVLKKWTWIQANASCR